MAARVPPQSKIRSPYSGRLFDCPPGCGCADCSMPPARPVTKVIVSVIAMTIVIVVVSLAGRALWALVRGQW